MVVVVVVVVVEVEVDVGVVVVIVVVGVLVDGCGPRPQKKMLPWSPTLKIMKTMKTKTCRRNKRNLLSIVCFLTNSTNLKTKCLFKTFFASNGILTSSLAWVGGL